MNKEDEAAKDVLIFLPGTMASCLRLGNEPLEKKLWHEDPVDSLSQLVRNPSLYRESVGTSLEAYDILSHVRTIMGKRDIYGRFRTFLQSLHGYRYGEFPYDWRKDIRVTSIRFGDWLRQNYDFFVDAAGRQLKEGRPRLSIVGHSMGGLVATLAMMSGHINPHNVKNFITIGTPYYGSPAAFKALYKVGYLPGMLWLDRLLNWRKDRRKCKQVLLEAIQSFCSIYQLLPPTKDKFVELQDGTTINPLDGPVVDGEKCDIACETHEALALFPQFLRERPWIRHHFIYGDYPDNTDKLYTAKVSATGRGYDSIVCYKSTHGDTTVPVASSSIKTISTALAPVVGVPHALMCADQRVIDLVLAYLSEGSKAATMGA